MRPEQELDLLNVEALVDKDGAEHYDVLAHALRLFPADQRAPIVAALVRWREAREGLDDGYFPTVRALRRWVQVCERRAMKHERDARKYTSSSYGPDAAELHKLLAVWGNDITFGDNNLDDDTDDDDTDDDGLDDDGLDDDTDDDGLDDDTDDESLDNDTDDEHGFSCPCSACRRVSMSELADRTPNGFDDEEHGPDCFCNSCCEAQMVGLGTVAGDDPDAYLARNGADGLAAVGREVLDEDSYDFNPCPRPPECDWCGGKGCDTCCDPNYAGVDP